MALQSNIIFAVREPFTSAKEPGETFAITNQFELDEVLEIPTATSVVFKNASQIERMEITATGGIATIVKRGLTQSDDVATEDVSLRKDWWDGDLGYITRLAFDQVKLDGNNTFTGDNTFDGINITDTNGVNFGDNAYIKSENNGTDLLFKDGNNVETTLSTLTAAAGADTKVSVSTNDTTTGTLEDKLIPWDWLKRVINNPGWAETRTESIDLITTNWLKFTTGQLDFTNADESNFWSVQRASTNEAISRTEWTKYITSDKLWYEKLVASDTVKASADTERNSWTSWDRIKVKEFQIWEFRLWGTCRLKYEAKGTEYEPWSAAWRLYVYKNGVEVELVNLTSATYQSFTSNDISVAELDLVQIYLQSQWVNSVERVSYVQNVDLCYDEVKSTLIPTVNLD